MPWLRWLASKPQRVAFAAHHGRVRLGQVRQEWPHHSSGDVRAFVSGLLLMTSMPAVPAQTIQRPSLTPLGKARYQFELEEDAARLQRMPRNNADVGSGLRLVAAIDQHGLASLVAGQFVPLIQATGCVFAWGCAGFDFDCQ